MRERMLILNYNKFNITNKCTVSSQSQKMRKTAIFIYTYFKCTKHIIRYV